MVEFTDEESRTTDEYADQKVAAQANIFFIKKKNPAVLHRRVRIVKPKINQSYCFRPPVVAGTLSCVAGAFTSPLIVSVCVSVASLVVMVTVLVNIPTRWVS